MGRPTWAQVDLSAVETNVRRIKERIGPHRELLAVVKANAYGHGAAMVAKAALQAGAARLGVACVDEGIQLRHKGVEAPILILGYTPPWEAERVVGHRLIPTVNSIEQGEAFSRAAAREQVPLPVHVKIDTGMNRFGLSPKEAVAFVHYLQKLPGLRVEGMYTHFAVADETDKSFTWQQFDLFMSVANRLPEISCRHVANSAAVLDLPEMCLDMVRVGISLYGVYPSAAVSRSIDLDPVLSLKSRIARLKTLIPGESVSYGLTWTASQPSLIALVPCGYADGLSRSLSNRGYVLIHGLRAPIAGRICMDLSMVDASSIPDVREHDEVTIIGKQGNDRIGAEEVAARADTISYEILCGISPRVPRLYLRMGEVIDSETLLEGR